MIKINHVENASSGCSCHVDLFYRCSKYRGREKKDGGFVLNDSCFEQNFSHETDLFWKFCCGGSDIGK